MPPLFWLDVVALGISTVIASSLTLMVLGAGPRRMLNLSFALFTLVQAAWAVVSLHMRFALWLERGNPLFLNELIALFLSLTGPCLLVFTVRYLGRRTRWPDLVAVVGVAAIAVLCVPLFRHELVLNPRLDVNGTALTEFGIWGGVLVPLPLLYLIWPLVLFWQERHRTGEPYLALGVLILVVGFIVGPILEIRVPITSITNTLSVVIIGYGVVSRQLFNPLREKTAELQRQVAERKRAEAERERLLTELEYRSTQLKTAAEVSKSASMILDPDELIRQVVELIQQRFSFYYVGLFLVDEAGEWAVLRSGTGQAGQRMLQAGHKLAVGGGSMIGQCVANAQARIALDVGKEAIRFDNPYLPDTHSEMALPLISRGRWCIGALTVQSANEAAFSAGDIAVLQTMADHLAIAIENARLYERVQLNAVELEERVAERTAELSTVNKELEAFAYSVSHDLRAPLRSIDGFSQALLRDGAGELTATGQDYLRRVRAASQRMGQLIDDLLNLSRLMQTEMRHGAVDLSALAQAIATELQQHEPERQVEFEIAEGVVAHGDARLLRVVLENLLGNAWKFTSKHPSARIEFGVTQVEDTPAYFVRDDGTGFDMACADKLFGAFQRLHDRSEFEGSGIGLATVQRIIHRHGGRTWAEGEVEQGATFYFTLPAGEREMA
jgi:signal transduction histidine kinase